MNSVLVNVWEVDLGVFAQLEYTDALYCIILDCIIYITSYMLAFKKGSQVGRPAKAMGNPCHHSWLVGCSSHFSQHGDGTGFANKAVKFW